MRRQATPRALRTRVAAAAGLPLVGAVCWLAQALAEGHGGGTALLGCRMGDGEAVVVAVAAASPTGMALAV